MCCMGQGCSRHVYTCILVTQKPASAVCTLLQISSSLRMLTLTKCAAMKALNGLHHGCTTCLALFYFSPRTEVLSITGLYTWPLSQLPSLSRRRKGDLCAREMFAECF